MPTTRYATMPYGTTVPNHITRRATIHRIWYCWTEDHRPVSNTTVWHCCTESHRPKGNNTVTLLYRIAPPDEQQYRMVPQLYRIETPDEQQYRMAPHMYRIAPPDEQHDRMAPQLYRTAPIFLPGTWLAHAPGIQAAATIASMAHIDELSNASRS